jgi:NAD(P)-dependent dehydrogenase (short-subunit alcohol dehydrogenase family)
MKHMNTKIALVTGGSRGIGRDSVVKIAAKGLDVILTYNTRSKEAEEVMEQVRKMGRKAAALQLSIDDLKSFDGFVERLGTVLQTQFGATHIDFLVNNAGSGAYGVISEATEEFFDQTLNIHFKGPYFLTQKLLPVINDGGGVVHISSALTRISSPGSSVYATMKSALETFSRYVAKEYGARGIRSNIIAPGATMTDFGNAHFRNDLQLQKTISAVTALGRPGTAEDIGGAVAFLCTEDARWINGQRIELSGGMLI